MNDKKLSVFTKAALIFLVCAVVFCAVTVFSYGSKRKTAEQKRLDNETQIAQMQLPRASGAPEAAGKGSEDNEIEELVPDEKKSASHSSSSTRTNSNKTVIVLDPGHGKSSSQMSDTEKESEGYVKNNGAWGEWRHYKSNTFGEDCEGEDCTHLAPSGGSCWYAMGNGDRDTEPEINLQNALAAKKYLEQAGYEVRMTRTTNDENPSMNKRVSYCFPNNDITQSPDAAAYICIHANAGGGRGTSYVSLSGAYEQKYIESDYIEQSNSLGNLINSKVAASAGLTENAPISSPYLILLNKSPVPIAYLEIGFYDDSSDLEIISSSSDEIGKAIADGVNEFFNR